MVGLNKILLLCTHITVITLLGAAIPVMFILENGSRVHENVDIGVYRMIDMIEKNQCMGIEKVEKSSSHAAISSESPSPVGIVLGTIPDISAYICFRMISNQKYAETLLERNSIGNISAQSFKGFLDAAALLGIYEVHRDAFVKNMIQYGLFGTNAASILEHSLVGKEPWEDMFWQMFQAFLDRVELQATVEEKGLDTGILFIDKKEAGNKAAEYRNIQRLKNIVAVLKTPLPSRPVLATPESERVFGWLLCHIRCSELHIDYKVDTTYNTVMHLSTLHQQMSLECKELTPVRIVGLVFVIDDYTMLENLPSMFGIYADLRCLTVYICEGLSEPAEIKYFAQGLSSCKALKKLRLLGKEQSKAFLSHLLGNIPAVHTLELVCGVLERSIIDDFKKLTGLASLTLYGKKQKSLFVRELLKSMPDLIEVELVCERLEDSVADSFRKEKGITSIFLSGETQKCSFVQKLANAVPTLKELGIVCEALDSRTAASFKHCRNLTGLFLYDTVQSNECAHRLLQNMLQIQTLLIEVDKLDGDLAKALRTCTDLQELYIKGEFEPDFLSVLFQSPCPTSMREAIITKAVQENNSIKEESAEDIAAICAAQEQMQIYISVVSESDL